MKRKLALLITLIMVLAVCLPAMGAISPITVIGVDKDKECTATTDVTIALHDDSTIRRAVVTLSASPEYAKDEIWYKAIYCSEDTTSAKATFKLNGKGVSQPYGSIVQSFAVTEKGCKYFNSMDIPAGTYYLHVTMYSRAGGGVSQVVGPFTIK